jgi:pro-kumamolisin-like protein
MVLTANTDDSSWERKRVNEPSRVNRPFHFIAVRLRRRGSQIEGLLPGWSVSPLTGRATDAGGASPLDTHEIVVSLNLRNRDALDAPLTDTRIRLRRTAANSSTQDEFNAAFAPDEEAIAKFFSGEGLTVIDRFSNRLLISVVGTVRGIEDALGVEIHKVHFKAQPHNSTLNDPLLPSGITGLVAGVIGLDDLAALHADARAGSLVARPAPSLGSNRCHLSLRRLRILQRLENIRRLGADDGLRRSVCVDGSANTTFNTTWGLPQWPSRRAQVRTGPQGSH